MLVIVPASRTRLAQLGTRLVPPAREPTASAVRGRLAVRSYAGSAGHARLAANGVKEHDKCASGGRAADELTNRGLLSARPAPALFSLANRTVVVTGGARGLGLSVARACLESGADMFCLDLVPSPSSADWASAASLAASHGARLTYAAVDVTDPPAVDAAIARAFATARPDYPVRGLFHAAGIQRLCPALDVPATAFTQVIDVNLSGAFHVSRAFAGEFLTRTAGTATSTPTGTTTVTATTMAAAADANQGAGPGARAGAGPAASDGTGQAARAGADPSITAAARPSPDASIVLVGSMSGRVANDGLACAAYGASKAGVGQLARSLALEWSGRGIRVNTLSPGYIRTALTAALLEAEPTLEPLWVRGSLLGRLSTPDEFRGPALFLLSDAASFMTGSDLVVDGGHTAH
ncbi:hypothetical protein Q5752_004943 [Cryptotrichosporon argae]